MEFLTKVLKKTLHDKHLTTIILNLIMSDLWITINKLRYHTWKKYTTAYYWSLIIDENF